MRQFSVTLFIIHPPKKTRQLKLLLIAQRAVKKDVSILEFQDIPILSNSYCTSAIMIRSLYKVQRAELMCDVIK